MNMPAAGSTIRTTGSAFNELVSVLLRLDPRLSQAPTLGITGEGCRLGERTHAPADDEGRQLKAGPRSMSHRTLWICPARGRPLNVVPTPDLGDAGAHRPLEISREIPAAHACVGAARFPQLHSALSSSIIRYQTDDEGVISEPEYTLTKPSSGPNDRDHLSPPDRTHRTPPSATEYTLTETADVTDGRDARPRSTLMSTGAFPIAPPDLPTGHPSVAGPPGHKSFSGARCTGDRVPKPFRATLDTTV